ncbi:glutamate racemase [Lacrimispora algidixylanolytica]|uniref:Glutamate racemase n=1 Tax=Lacrimispora algidixylanolytica TaxID=94868 RepID=A0A419T3I0_9FIRM|nr:glutamate racemase [Lacrimispora algidixylanolytica]RKD31989.1 glutamate racemase [Lacrimispora algidixylanolytica]
MADRNSPIGVFDSGVGGLTVVREIMRQMPEERLVYFGDTARVPYGTKSKDTIVRYTRQNIRFLMTQDVKAIVIACNTATAFALEIVEQELKIPVMGVIHAGAKTAVEATRNGKIGIIGTEGTIRSGVYTKMMEEMRDDIEVIGKSCPLFVPLVEEGLLHDSVTDEIASRYLSELKGKFIDTLVLGCTHYPLLRSTVGRVMGPEVTLVNPAYETALELKQVLSESQLLNDTDEPFQDKYHFYVSDLAEKFTNFASSILPDQIKQTKKINIEDF